MITSMYSEGKQLHSCFSELSPFLPRFDAGNCSVVSKKNVNLSKYSGKRAVMLCEHIKCDINVLKMKTIQSPDYLHCPLSQLNFTQSSTKRHKKCYPWNPIQSFWSTFAHVISFGLYLYQLNELHGFIRSILQMRRLRDSQWLAPSRVLQTIYSCPRGTNTALRTGEHRAIPRNASVWDFRTEIHTVPFDKSK